MALETTEDMALSLKKRARRRLVGSIILVLLLLVILPNVLKNRVNKNHDEINLTMPDVLTPTEKQVAVIEGFPDTPLDQESVDDASLTVEEDGVVASALDDMIQSEDVEVLGAKGEKLKDVLASKEVSQPNITKKIPKAVVKKKTVTKKASKSGPNQYLVQVGVFSDVKNVERLQAKIAAAGFSSNVSTVNTPKGDVVRLRVGTFVTREAAAKALNKLKQNDLPGMVMTSN